MSRTRIRKGATCARGCAVQTLVISQHEAVRQQLVIYLSRSPSLAVTGAAFSPSAIAEAHPDVLVLDLSQLDLTALRDAIEASQRVGARLIALASLRDPRAEELVVRAGGRYQLKVAGANGLAELVHEAMSRPTPGPRVAPLQTQTPAATPGLPR
jgi:DNA-binding NarL/FixJ family response regulator